MPPYPLLLSLQNAAESLIRTDPEAWLTWVERLGALDMAPAQRLIAHTFALVPERFSTLALRFLLENPRRYMLGSIHDFTGTSSRLVKAASDHWSGQEIARFETALNEYRPSPPVDLTDPRERRDWHQRVRRVRLALLRELPRNQLTDEARRHVEEEERAFPDRVDGLRFTGVHAIQSIMDADQITRASNEDVVNAFRTVPDASGWDHPRDFMTGGNIQLSREFATFAKANPGRASLLLGSLEPENGTRAAGYALEAMSEDVVPDHVLQLLRDVVERGFDSEEFRSSASRAIAKLVGRSVTVGDDMVALLDGWLAVPFTDGMEIEDTDSGDKIATGSKKDQGGETKESVRDEIVREEAKRMRTADVGPEVQKGSPRASLLWGMGSFSIVPGGDCPVLEALIRIRLARGEFDQLDGMLRNYLERNKAPQLWDYVLRFLLGLHPTDPVRRAAILDTIFSEVPELIGSRAAAYLLADAIGWNSDFTDAQLETWRRAGNRSARQAYGEIVALASLRRPELVWAQARLRALIEDRALVDARAGAALTAARFWNDIQLRSKASDLLKSLLQGGGEGVWEGAFEVFRLVDELKPDGDTVALLSIIADRLHEAPAPSRYLCRGTTRDTTSAPRPSGRSRG